jgi:hypothetical protein
MRTNTIISTINTAPVNWFAKDSDKSNDKCINYIYTINKISFIKVQLIPDLKEDHIISNNIEIRIIIQFKTMSILFKEKLITENIYDLNSLTNLGDIHWFRDYFTRFKNSVNKFELA